MRLNSYVCIGMLGLLVFYHFNIECLADKDDEGYIEYRKQEYSYMRKHCYTNIDSAKIHLENLIDAAEANNEPLRQLGYINWACTCVSHNNSIGNYQYFLDKGTNLIARLNQDELFDEADNALLDKRIQQFNLHAIDYYNLIGDEVAIRSIVEPLIENIQKRDTIKQVEYSTLVSAYMYLGVVYLKLGDYQQAYIELKHSERFLEKLDKKEGKDGMLYKHFASYYGAMNKKEAAEEYYKKAAEVNLNSSVLNRKRISYNTLIELTIEQGLFEENKSLLDSAATYFEKGDPFFERFLFLKGLNHIGNNDIALGKKEINEAFGIYEQTGLDEHVFFISHLFKAVKLLLEKGEDEAALAYYEMAMQKWNEVKSKLPLFNDSADIFKELNELLVIFYQKRINNNDLASNIPTRKALLHQAISSIKCIDSLKIYLTAPVDKSQLIRDTHDLYEIAVQLYYEFLAEDPAFKDSILYVMEKSKNAFLVEHLNQSSVLVSMGVNEKSIKEFNILQAESMKKKDVLSKVKDRSQRDDLLANIKIIDDSIKIMQAQFEKNNPAYQQLINPDIPSIKTLQSYITNSDEVLLQYMVTGESVYVIVIGEGESKVIPLPQKERLDSLRHQLERSISQKIDTMYARTSHQLYQQLFLPIEKEMNFTKNPQKIRIIPDMEIGFIPFEALTKRYNQQPEDYSKYDYLIKKYEFVYDLSTVFVAMRNQASQQAEKEIPYDYIAFALTDFQRSEEKKLSILAHSVKSVKAYAANWSKKQLFIDSAAIKEKFKQVYNQGQILELVTHAKAKGQNLAHLEFYDESLFTNELWGLDLQSILVILTACETGIGKLQQGEGIKSLGRAFYQAGAATVMDTYWETNDKETLTLMKHFHKKLARGLPKTEALREAKRTVLTQNPNLIPRHWAAFKLTGDDTIIAIKSRSTIPSFVPFLLGGLSLLFLSLIWYNKRKVAS